ncbi:MAG: VCBS repeat-containing protein [Polyangiaceae bacterium]
MREAGRVFLTTWAAIALATFLACGGDDLETSTADGGEANDAAAGNDVVSGKDASMDSGHDASDAGRDATVDAFTDADADENDDAPADGDVDADDASDDASDASIFTIPPIPRFPFSTARETSQTPLFEWILPPGVEMMLLDICNDRACASPISAGIDVTSPGSYSPTTPLPPGVIFWRLRAQYSDGSWLSSATRELTIGPLSAPEEASWGSTLDVNGDGYADVAVGSPGENKVYLYMGSASGLATMPALTLTGPDSGAFGRSVSSAGDVNGDGFADLIVGAPSTSNGVAGAVGTIYVYLGGAAGLASTPTTTWVGPGGNDGFFGSSVTSMFDSNSYGSNDIAVGAYGESMATGRVYVARGSAIAFGSTPVLDTDNAVIIDDPNASPFDFFGKSISGCGLFYDGCLLVGADGTSGLMTAYLFEVSPGSSSSSLFATFSMPAGALDFGSAVGDAGDVNGDGFDDFIIGAPSAAGGQGQAFVYLGANGGVSTTPNTTLTGLANWHLGISVASAGDVNADGYGDVIVGTADPSSVGVLYLGSSSGLSTTGTTLTAFGGGIYPNIVSSAGDVDRDGFSDFLVGSAGAALGDGGASNGFVYLFKGSMTAPGTSPDLSLSGFNAGGQFGRSVFGATN